MSRGFVNILLVDDDVRNLDVLESVLNAPEYRLVRAKSADEALLALLNTEFAAIVLDIQMPGTSGIELAHLIKQRKRTQHIPIIFLTAYFQEDKNILEGYEVGAVDYLNKPVNPEILKSKVAVFVELFQKTRELASLARSMEVEILQRQTAEEALRKANSELEARVLERTEELTEANEDLRTGELALRSSEQRLKQMLSLMPAGVYTCDVRGRITFYNDRAVELWGRNPQIGKDLWCGSHRMFRPDGTPLPLNQCPLAIALTEGRSIRGQEIIVERPDGTRQNVLSYPEPILDDKGAVIGAVNMLVDVTEERRAVQARRESDTRLRQIVSLMPTGVYACDESGRITFCNRRAVELWGREPRLNDEVEKFCACHKLYLSDGTLTMPSETPMAASILEGKSFRDIETIVERPDGSRFTASASIDPIRDVNGRIIGAVNVFQDVSERKRVEESLQKAKSDAETASRAKDDFLAALSHELRTPLNPVLLLASEAAEDSTLPDHARGYFATIRNNVELEARLIDDLLDITRISRGKLALDLHTLDVHEVLRNAFSTVKAELEDKRISVTFDLSADQRLVKGDSVRLIQVFWNILKNAVKFTPKLGRITVATSTMPESRELVVSVSDSGIGMTAEELSRPFDAFCQGDHARGGASSFGGLGLGLAISRMIVELHLGVIQAFSEGRDRGATFIVRLPLCQDASYQEDGVKLASKPTTPEISSTAPETVFSGTRILLVEDHEPTRTALAHLLVRRKYHVETAACVEEARALASKGTFQFIISDIGLPDGNGYDLMTEFHKRYQLRGIALTGYGTEKDIDRSRNSGFVAHLTKPVSMQSLVAALATTCGGECLQV